MKSLVESVILHKRHNINTLNKKKKPPQYENIILKLCNLLGSLYAFVSIFSFFLFLNVLNTVTKASVLKDSCSVSSYSDILFFFRFFFIFR